MIQPFTLILSGHPEARPTPTAALLTRVPATKARVGRTAALLVPIKAEHGGREVQRLKCRDSRRGSEGPGTGHYEEGAEGQGWPRATAVEQMLTMKKGCGVQSPFPWALLTLLPGPVHGQQLPKESSGLKDTAQKGRKLVWPSLANNDY